MPRVALLICGLIYIGSLQWIYPSVVVPLFSYAGMVYEPQSWEALSFQTILALVPLIWLPKTLVKPSQYQNWILYLTVWVPTCVLPFHVTSVPPSQLYVFLLVLLACFFSLHFVSYSRSIWEWPFSLSPYSYLLLILILTLITYGSLIYYLGAQSLFLPFEEVYDVRTEVRYAGLPVIVGYLIWWQGAVVNPIISAIGFLQRRWLLVLMSAFLQVQLYSLTSLRTFVAASALQLGLGAFMTMTRARAVGLFAAVLLVTWLSVAWNYADSTAIGPLLVLNRWIFNAGELSGYYFEFFSQNPTAGLQHSALLPLRLAFPGPYDLPTGQVIGAAYFFRSADGTFTNATAHIWADGFASFGYVGLITATLMAALLLWLADSASRNRDPRFALLSFCVVGISMSGQSVFSTVLTGGFAPFIGLILIMPKEWFPADPRKQSTIPVLKRGRATNL